MSIADKITQLSNIRAAIRTALQNKGIAAASSHNFADFAADIAAIATGATLQSKRVSALTSGPLTVRPDSGYDGLSQVIVNMILRQAKTVTPGTADQTVSPDSGYQGLSSVTVEGDADLVAGNIKSGVEIFGVTGSYAPAAITLQSKSVTPSASAQTVVADSGYDGLSQVDVAAAPLETKSVTPTAAAQTITPSSGKIGMSQVNVAATPLQAKSATPGASQQIITPGSGYVGLSQVTVAGDADLVAGNIKSGVQIFGVTGSYAPQNVPINGSLIVATCSSDIDTVKTTINGTTYTGYLDTSSHIAYITIPYTITNTTINVDGYTNGVVVTSSTVTITGINKYTCTLTTSSVLYNAGTWTGLDSHTWEAVPSTGGLAVTEYASLIGFVASADSGDKRGWFVSYLSPKVSLRGYTNIKVTVSYVDPTYDQTNFGFRMYVSDSVLRSAQYMHGTGIKLSVGENTYTVPSNLVGQDVYLMFGGYAWNNETITSGRITKIEFV